ncbi:uncharacterized protein LOC142270515 [Anomaloglossus baeobatrachus]|uniref:uncharacterized protein LOC142270515 n=1 Tax=Anomaloglossus baeobatrachus TaxID=238106 RepID=UPI003F505530
MAAVGKAWYKQQTKEVLAAICTVRQIDPAGKHRQQLITELLQYDAEQVHHPSPEEGEPSQGLDGAAAGSPPVASSQSSNLSSMDPYLHIALQQLSVDDREGQLQLIQQYQDREAERIKRRAQAEREAEQAERRAQAERQAEQAEHRAQAEREAERAERMTQAKREAAERQAQRDHELKVLQLRQRPSSPLNCESEVANSFLPRPEHFPVLENDGDVYIFLRGFETTCLQYQLPKNQWTRYLIPVLRGKALEVFASLPEEQAGDYEAIKQALIRKYQLTPEVYRQRFRTLQRGPHESNRDVVERLRANFDQWTQGLSVTTAEELMDLLVKEQFLHRCPVDVRQFVMDREPKDANTAAEIACAYEANHMPEVQKPSAASRKRGKVTTTAPASRPPGGPLSSASTRPASDPRRCFSCNRTGHLRSTCPERQKRSPTPKAPGPRAAVPYVGGAVGWSCDNMQSVTVGNTITVGLRSTSAKRTLVRPELLSPENFILGKTLTINGMGGVVSLPVAKVFLDWGVGRGVREVGVSAHLPIDVLLGTDLGRIVAHFIPGAPPRSRISRDSNFYSLGFSVVHEDDVSPDTGELGHGTLRGNNAEDPLGGANVSGKGHGDHKAVGPVQLSSVTVDGDKSGGSCPMISTAPEALREVEKVLSRAGQADEKVLLSPGDTAYISAVTRSQTAQNAGDTLPSGPSSPRGITELVTVPEVPGEVGTLTSLLAASSREFQAALHADVSLVTLRDLAEKPFSNTGKERVFWDQGRLYRETVPCNPQQEWLRERQLVVPYRFRDELLRIAHEIPLAGHLGVSKTKARLSHHFYWPKMGTDISNYCRSCITCQRVGKLGPAPKAPLISLPVIEEFFQRVAVDIVGPLAVPSSSGKRFVLTVVDFATRYPEAVALSSVRADEVADALLAIFSRVGYPRRMLSDQGTQFMCRLVEAFCKKMQVRCLVSGDYPPQTNGWCARFNGTLNQMLKMLVESHGRDWERYLPHLLFAYREVPQASTGFSPIELLYGRRVRGPLGLVRESWEEELNSPEVSVVEYVMRLRDKMQSMTWLVDEDMVQAQASQKLWYDQHARERVYEAGQKVRVLVPMTQNKLQAAWEGPYLVHQRLNDVNYVVTIDHASQKVFHVNMIKAHDDWEASALARQN